MATVEIFSSPGCGYCERAKQRLAAKGIAYVDLDIAGDDKHRAELLRRLPRARALPQIFIDGEHIGGFDDLCLLDETGRLDALTGDRG